MLILDTVLNSAEKLYQYQAAYNDALRGLAQANGIEYQSLDQIPGLLQKKTFDEQRAQLTTHFDRGGVVAVAVNGMGATGKGTVAGRSGMPRAVNYTTRPRRPTEVHGVDYYYISILEGDIDLDKDTGYKVLKRDPDTNKPTEFETDENGKPIDYFAKYGPYLTTVHRQGRARHGTSAEEFKRLFNGGERAISFEQGVEQVQEAVKELPQLIENAIVMPVWIMPPGEGILALASRIAVRTYGDEEHRDPDVDYGYKIADSYLESTIGTGQIQEMAWVKNFSQGEDPLGVVFIVNDRLDDAVETLKRLVAVP